MLSSNKGRWPASTPASGLQVIDRLIRATPLLWSHVTNGSESHKELLSSCTEVATIAEHALATPCPTPLVEDRLSLMRIWREQLARLQLEPRISQRSEAWYEARSHLATASDVAAAIGGRYGSNKEFLVKKAGGPEEQKPFSGTAPPLKWGVMFEPIANAIYSKRMCVQVHEFGLLRHPTIPHIGASPDGITDMGIVLEIKCPFSRIIDGTVPSSYIAQIQCQLDVCGLDECDFFQCQFEETLPPLPSREGHMNVHWDGCECGILVERWDDPGKSYRYDYCPEELVGSDSDAAVQARETWADEVVRGMSLTTACQAIVRRWRLKGMDLVRVHRDPGYILSMNANLAVAWQRVLRYRGDRDAYRAEVHGTGPKASRTVPAPHQGAPHHGQETLQGYAFLDDS